MGIKNYDLKGESYQLPSDYQNAILFYNRSLGYKQDPSFFHEKTLKKLNEC